MAMNGEEIHVALNKNTGVTSSCEEDELQSFRTCLKWMCVDQSNRWRASLSWFIFFLLAIVVPLLSHFILACDECDGNLHRPYDGVVQLSLSSIAAVSFLSLSKIFRNYGMRRFLYLDRLYAETLKVRQGYTTQLHRSTKLLSLSVIPCFVAEGAYKVWWYSFGANQISFLGSLYGSDVIACIMELWSWLYRTSIFFLLCVLFRLICSLQIVRLHDFAQAFQEESDVGSILKEHLRIRRQLRIISHRFRAFIVGSLVIITASQFASLLNTTRPHSDIHLSIYWAGELALCSMTLLAGLFIMLRSAAKITHKAQSITCLAAKWHICATLYSFDLTDGETPTVQNASLGHFSQINTGGESEGDDAGDEEDDIDTTNIMDATHAHTICFQKRQALVTYFENNKAGITVFGFMMDRTYIHTIFAIELSLVLWLLQKTIGIS